MIVVISRLKNSADIIESWIRGNAAVADKFVVIDNESVDGTVQILKLLKAEGFDIEILEADNPIARQRDQMNWLVDYVHDKYDPDWILPLDDDEILASDSVQDIRGYLSSLPRDKEYKVRWRVYTLRGNEDNKVACPLLRIGSCFINNQYDFPTVLLTREVVERGVRLTQGNHALTNYEELELPPTFLNKLYLAHYPIRSKEQLISKFLVGWTNYLATPVSKSLKEKNYWSKVYNDILRDRNISDEYLRNMIGLYRQRIYVENVDEIVWKIVNLRPEAFIMKYSNGDVDYFYNYIRNTEIIARQLAKYNQKNGQEEFRYDFNAKDQAF